jgi:uncharacterized protein (DUF58 family)
MPETRETTALLGEEFLRRLDQLELVFRKAAAGRLRGERPSRKRGQGTDFADYRDYVHGDDPRFIDWNVYGRLDRLFLKLFVEEEDLHLHVLIDTSASMAFGEPSKFDAARRLAAALSYVALVGQNRVAIVPVGEGAPAPFGPVRGRNSALRAFAYLQGLAPAGKTALAASARAWGLAASRKGVAVLLSDLLDPGHGTATGFEEAAPFLAGRALDAHVVQILSPDEIEPGLRGDLRLLDAETDEFAEVSIGEQILRKYRANLRGFLDRARAFCLRRGIAYIGASSETPFEKVVLEALRRGGLLR